MDDFGFNIVPSAQKQIDHYATYDPPVANSISQILLAISEDSSEGKTYGELSEKDKDERRLKEAFALQSPNQEYEFHWKNIELRALHTQVLSVVVYAPRHSTIIAVGYLSRQSSILR